MIPNTVTWSAISKTALQANKNFIKDKDYVIHPNRRDSAEIVLPKPGDGRLMEMTRLQGGLHQAIGQRGLKLTQKHGPWLLLLTKTSLRCFGSWVA